MFWSESLGRARHQLTTRLHSLFGADVSLAGFKKYATNTGWLFFGRVITFVVSFFTLAMVTRYLGPENLGTLSYAQSLLTIVSMLASLGIDHIVYRDLVAEPDQEGKILGTAIAIKFCCGLLTLLGTVGVASLSHNEPLIIWLIGLIGLTFIFQPLGVVGHVFNALVLARYTTYISLSVTAATTVAKLLVIYFDQGLLFFASIIAFEVLLNSVMCVVLYHMVLKRSWRTWTVSLGTAKVLVWNSWPIMLVGMTGYLYMRIDQVMLQHTLGPQAVGLYEAAVRITEPLGIVPGVIMGSLFPAVVHARLHDRQEYRRRLRALAILCLSISGTLALILFVTAPLLIQLLYGSAFTESLPILRIYAWSTMGTIAMALMFNYFVIEGRTYLQLLFTCLGAITNITLNSLFIPAIGLSGAAYSTLLTTAVIIIAFFVTKRFLWR